MGRRGVRGVSSRGGGVRSRGGWGEGEVRRGG